MKRGKKPKEDKSHVKEHLEVIMGVDCAFGEGDCL